MTAKKKTPKKLDCPKPTICRPPISEDILQALESRYSMPVKSPLKEKHPEIWNAVGDLKGWLRKGNDRHEFRYTAWVKIREILDLCVSNFDASGFESFAKAWQNWEVSKKPPINKKSGYGDPWKNEEASWIENLLPLPCNNSPNSRVKLEVIEAILSTQKHLGRAPSRSEIEAHLKPNSKTPGTKESGLEKNKIIEIVNEMGIGPLLSGSRKSRHNPV